MIFNIVFQVLIKLFIRIKASVDKQKNREKHNYASTGNSRFGKPFKLREPSLEQFLKKITDTSLGR